MKKKAIHWFLEAYFFFCNEFGSASFEHSSALFLDFVQIIVSSRHSVPGILIDVNIRVHEVDALVLYYWNNNKIKYSKRSINSLLHFIGRYKVAGIKIRGPLLQLVHMNRKMDP